jgi:hypothetical protein
MFQRIYYGTNVFLGYLERDITCSLSLSRHEQYPSNNVNQNNSAHGVYKIPK